MFCSPLICPKKLSEQLTGIKNIIKNLQGITKRWQERNSLTYKQKQSTNFRKSCAPAVVYDSYRPQWLKTWVPPGEIEGVCKCPL